jgi:hypothetical protein
MAKVQASSLASPSQESRAVLEYLAWAEQVEGEPWIRDDIRLAWICVRYAGQGYQKPWEFAFWFTYGKAPEKLIPEFVTKWERRQTWGDLQLWVLETSVPKKPVQSVRQQKEGYDRQRSQRSARVFGVSSKRNIPWRPESLSRIDN